MIKKLGEVLLLNWLW